jgi:hypothetical protein
MSTQFVSYVDNLELKCIQIPHFFCTVSRHEKVLGANHLELVQFNWGNVVNFLFEVLFFKVIVPVFD